MRCWSSRWRDFSGGGEKWTSSRWNYLEVDLIDCGPSTCERWQTGALQGHSYISKFSNPDNDRGAVC
jgi:hypothetical protein